MKSLYPKDHLCCYCSEEADDYVIDGDKYVLVCRKHLPILEQEKDADLSDVVVPIGRNKGKKNNS